MSAGTANVNFRYILKLAGTAIILQSLGWVVSTFPFFIFFAYMPLIGLGNYLHDQKSKLSFEIIGVFSIAFIIPAFVKFFIFGPSLINFAASISPVLTFLLWFYSGRVLGSLKGFYLLVFWLGVEYIFFLINPPVFNHLPGGAFRLWGESMGYVRFLGFQGTTIWLILTNLLFARCFFDKQGKVVDRINRIGFVIASSVGVMPMVISMLLFSGNPQGDLTVLFANASKFFATINHNPFYSIYLELGEYPGKLSSWLSIAILLSLVVKQIRFGYGN